MIDIDFETFCEISIRDVSVPAYVAHKSFEVLCMVAKTEDGILLFKYDFFNGAIAPECPFDVRDQTFVAHNASFERYVWNEYLSKTFGWPEIKSSQWICTAERAATMGLPRSLDGCGKALGCETVKDDGGKRVMLKLCRPRKPSKKNENDRCLPDTHPEDFETLYRYCTTDVEAEAEIHERLPKLQVYERSIVRMDREINDVGIPLDNELVDAAANMRSVVQTDIADELKEITHDVISSPSQTIKIKIWVNERGANLDDLQASTLENRLLYGEDLRPDVRRVLQLRQAGGLASIAKFEKMKAWRSPDGRCRATHMYCGAHTRRWAGKGVQFQNIPAGSLIPSDVEYAIELIKAGDVDALRCQFGDLATTLQDTLRGAVRASRGHTLRIADFAGIENRVLAWLSGQDDAVERFERNEDAYCVMASHIYPEYSPEEIRALHDAGDSKMRKLGKTAELGLGYGMGGRGFQLQCRKDGAELSIGPENKRFATFVRVKTAGKKPGQLTAEHREELVAEFVKTIYRETHADICSFWYALSDAAISATQTPDEIFHAGAIRFRRTGSWLMCMLPSKGRICYPMPSVTWEARPATEEQKRLGITPTKRPILSYMKSSSGQWRRDRTYGAKLAENVTQAVSRDVLAESMIRVRRHGYRIVMHVHDEIVSEDKRNFGTIEEFVEIMEENPKWAEGCPIAVEGFEATRYRKG